ncbi:MAG: hypothetical protein IJP98_04225 [Clostridia bacterium]|nr:hypothetical protein [Clostridia bacterium]
MQQETARRSPPDWRSFLRSHKRLRYLGYGLVAGLAVLLYFAGTDRLSCARASPQPEPTAAPAARDRLEQRLIEVLSQIRGAGRVDVLVTYETSGEIVTAVSSRTDEEIRDAITGTDSSTQRSASTVTEPATVKNEAGQSPIILSEKEPVVRGVIVVAEGAAMISVRKDLQNAVRAVTGVSLSQIEVFEMTSDTYTVPTD